MDEPPMDILTKALGEEEATALRAVFDHVQTVQSGVWIHRPDLSSGVDPEGPPGRNMWLQVNVVPGMNARAEAYIAKVAEATRQVAPEITYQAYAPLVGEPNFHGSFQLRTPGSGARNAYTCASGKSFREARSGPAGSRTGGCRGRSIHSPG
jgi:hypothetical protein